METSTLLPCSDGIEIDSVMAQQEAIVVRLSTVAPDVACPLCGRLSGRVHSRYERTLTDLPWNRITVRLHLRTRKFFCDNGGCQRQVFTEPIPELAARYARKTARLSDTLLCLTYTRRATKSRGGKAIWQSPIPIWIIHRDRWDDDEDGAKKPRPDSDSAARMLKYLRELETYITNWTLAFFRVKWSEPTLLS